MLNEPSAAFFALYDGHHKSMAVNHVHAKLLDCISQALKKGSEVRQAVSMGMTHCDNLYIQSPTVLTDDRFGSGSGAIVVMVQMGTLFTSNLGACRAVLCKGAEAEILSRDHVATDERESKRVLSGKEGRIAEDGMVSADFNGKEYRSPITRSIGNAQLKRVGAVTCRVEVSERELTRQDKFLIIASPGLWSVMTSQQAVDHVRRMIVEWPSKLDDVALKAMCGMLSDEALDLGVERAVTVILVVFADVTKLGLRDLYIENKIKAKKAEALVEINRRHGHLTPSRLPHS